MVPFKNYSKKTASFSVFYLEFKDHFPGTFRKLRNKYATLRAYYNAGATTRKTGKHIRSIKSKSKR